MSEDKQEKVQIVKGKYVPVKPIDPNSYTIKEFFNDTNTLLTQIELDLRVLIDIEAQKTEENKKTKEVKTIGIRKN